MAAASNTITEKDLRDRLEPRNYEIICPLGAGGFAQVFKVKNKGAKQREEACKVTNRILTEKKYGAGFELKKEPEMSSKLQHPHIVRIFHAFKTHTYMFTFMELCSGGSLQDLIDKENKKNDVIELNQAITYFVQIASAVKYMHSKGFAHRDIKPDNILLNSENIPKLADFGFVTQIKDKAGNKELAKTACGTAEYQCPEIGTGHYDPALADVYALGVTFYEMLLGLPPFMTSDENERLALKKKREMAWYIPGMDRYWFPEQVRKIVERMLHPNPKQRITSEQVIVYIAKNLMDIFEEED
jgi:serine/threonine protein kinase